MLDNTTTGGTQPDLQLIKELIMDVTVIDSLDCKDHDVVDFKLLRERRKANSILYNIGYHESRLQLAQDRIGSEIQCSAHLSALN